MDFTPRILLIILLIGGGFLFPLLWLGAAVIAFTVYADSRPTKPDAGAGRFPIIHETEEDWLREVRDCAESHAETAFIDAMVDAFKLKPRDGALRGSGLAMKLQVQISQYRVDFLVDETLVVEVDGAKWHSSPGAVARDRARDDALSELGYTVLRIPAKITLNDPDQAVRMVKNACIQAAAEQQRRDQDRSKALRSAFNPANLARTASEKMTALSVAMEDAAERAKAYRDRVAAEEVDPENIAEVLREQQKVLDAILAEVPPGTLNRFRAVEVEVERERLAKWHTEIANPISRPSTVSQARGRLKIMQEHLDISREMKALEQRLADDVDFREIFDSLDDKDFLESSPPAKA